MNEEAIAAFIVERWHELWQKVLEHLTLTGISTGIAVSTGIPCGVWVYRTPRIRGTVLGFTGVVQTLPSLAVLALLLPLFGIGMKPAIVALTLYALLPIVRNTYTGLTEVPASAREAAMGVGFTEMQQLFMVELPLALPFMIAGIRTAAVISVGIATLCSFIGAGGLGDFINRGLAMNNARLLLLGAIPAGVLALLLDAAIGLLARRLSWKER